MSRHGPPSWPLAAALAGLAAPRILLHDLDVVDEGSPVNAALVALPLVAWLVAILVRRWRPLAAGLRLGVAHGVLLALVHQLTWSATYADDPPRLGGNLADVPEGVQEVVLRTLAIGSSLVTGFLVALMVAALAWVVARVSGRDAARHGREPTPEVE